MFRFKKKKVEQSSTTTPPIKTECIHKWRDFSPVLEFKYRPYTNVEGKKLKYGRLYAEINESYVCCLCMKRENHTLYTMSYDDITEEDALARIKELKAEYKDFVKPKGIVEDEIADMQHNIDRDFLRALALFHPEKVGSAFSSITKIPTLDNFKGE